MCLEYRMSNTNSKNSPGFFDELFNSATTAVGNATKVVKNAMPGTNTRNTSQKPVLPVTAGTQAGGMAPVNYRVAQMQPSEATMRWATTAGADMPSKAEMRGVAHGGRRSRRRSARKTISRRYRKSKRATGGRRKTHMRKSYRKRRN
jgi:hypothetical protein